MIVHTLPHRAPVDPESLDATRPDDIDDCPVCHGSGMVDDHTLGYVRCRQCGGTGEVNP